MPMLVEAHALRALAFRWQARAWKACDEFKEYKGARACRTCSCGADEHVCKEAAAELFALAKESQVLQR